MNDQQDLRINKLFRAFIDLRASEMRLQVDEPVSFRLRGTLSPLDMLPFDEDRMREYLWPLLDGQNQEAFKNDGCANFNHVIEYKGELWRFRVNLFIDTQKMCATVRRVDG